MINKIYGLYRCWQSIDLDVEISLLVQLPSPA